MGQGDKMITELETIMANLALAVQEGELTQQEAIDLLDDFQDHEFESYRERYVPETILSKQVKHQP
jgi:hypothetical protein